MATPRGKARRKETRRKYEAIPHGKAKLKEYQRRYGASPHGKARGKGYRRKCESQSRIEQDLLMLESGIGTKELLRRLAIYTKLVFGPSAQHEEFALRYAERVGQASVYLGKRR